MLQDIIKVMLLLVINFMEFYVYYKFMSTLFYGCIFNWKIAAIVYVIGYMLSVYELFNPSYPLVNFCSAILCIFAMTLCYHTAYLKRIIATFLVLICKFWAELLLIIAKGTRHFALFQKSQDADIFTSIIIVLILWFITIIVQKLKNIKSDVVLPVTFTIAVIIILFLSVAIESLVFQQKSERILILASMLCVTCIDAVIIYLYDAMSGVIAEKAQNEVIKRERIYYREQSKLLQENQKSLRIFRHDIKNHMQVIGQLAENKQVEGIKKYISKITEELDSVKIYSSTGNVEIDSIINYKLSKAANKGIEIYPKILLPKKIDVEENDIVVILGNLLDNAIEASEKVNDKKYIVINAEYEKSSVFLEIRNSYNNLNISEGKILTTKQDKELHGIGLNSVKDRVHKYNGIIETEYDRTEFAVTIMLYL